MKKIISQFFLICFFASLFLSSCSRFDLAVQFANTYVANKADNYFDLTRDQRKWLRASFEKDFLLVQKIIFPQIASEMFKAADIINSRRPLDTTTVMLSYERAKNLIYDGLRMFSSNAVTFVDSLTPSQIVYFQNEFDKKMRDLRDDDTSRESYKKIKNHFDSWMGNMSAIQKNELELFTKNSPPPTAEKIYNRQMLAHEFVRSYPIKERSKQFMIKITTKFEQVYENQFSKSAKERNNKLASLVASILNKMTNDQRQSMSDTLRDRANQLLKISKG